MADCTLHLLYNLAQGSVRKNIIREFKLIRRYSMDGCWSFPLKGECPGLHQSREKYSTVTVTVTITVKYSTVPAGVSGPDIERIQMFEFPRSEETVSRTPDLAALARVGRGLGLAVPGLDVPQCVDVLLSSEHPQLAVSPAGSIPLNFVLISGLSNLDLTL